MAEGSSCDATANSNGGEVPNQANSELEYFDLSAFDGARANNSEGSNSSISAPANRGAAGNTPPLWNMHYPPVVLDIGSGTVKAGYVLGL